MNTIVNPKKEQWPELLQRPTQTIEAIESTVNAVFEDARFSC